MHNFACLEYMKNALADHYVTAEGLSEREATAKSKAFVVGMESSRLTGWSWPKEEKVVNALKKDLVDAFNTEKFQKELATLHEKCFADRKQFMAAMRDTAMIAQKEVLRKHNFAGLEDMKNALAGHYVTAEGLSEREATAKSKAFVVGMESSRLTGWSWPKEEKVVNVLKKDLVDAF